MIEDKNLVTEQKLKRRTVSLDFILTRKQLINANDSSKGNWRVKMGVVKFLRNLAYEEAMRISEELNSKVFFNHAKITTIVMPPTRRRVDPPNFAPTTKAIVDGLTDAGWWEDDDFSRVVESSFRYGGLSGEKGHFRIIVTVEEVLEEELGSFVLTPEISLLFPKNVSQVDIEDAAVKET